MKLGEESIEMVKIFDWVRHNKLDDIIWHMANERKCSPQQGAMLKRMGVKSGISDIIVAKARMGYHSLFIELKVKGGTVSDAQKGFLQTVNREGFLGVVRWSADEAIETIKTYLGIGDLVPKVNMPPNCS